MPAVTVVMPVYNGERYLREAIDSILGQSFRDFELLLIDDGSTDGSAAIMKSYADPRVRILPNGTNRGLVFSLNRGLAEASGQYTAIMHADDIALPHRLGTQVASLDRNPRVGVVGSWFESFTDTTRHVVRLPDRHEGIVAGLHFNSQLGHPTVMLRLSVLREHGLGYSPEMFPTEDWDMWVRCMTHTRLANIPRVLLRYRMHASSITGGTLGAGTRETAFTRNARTIFRRILPRIGVELTPERLETHIHIAYQFPVPDRGVLFETRAWLLELVRQNRRTRAVPEPAFSAMAASWWFGCCQNLNTSFAEKWRQFLTFPGATRSLLEVARRRLAGYLPLPSSS